MWPPQFFDRRFIQSIVDQSLAAASEILVKSVDARLEEFKRRFRRARWTRLTTVRNRG